MLPYRRLLILGLALLLVCTVVLTAAGVALAQVSDNYNLVCWGSLTGGGGARATAQYQLLDSLGQPAGPESTSSLYRLRPGTIQVRPGPQPPAPEYANKAYVPLVSAATALGICSW